MKVIIIGAGIIGSAIANSLTRAAADVTVLDQTGPGAGASGKSFGWINASFAETDPYFRLRSRALPAFRALCDTLDLTGAVTWSGCLWWEDDGGDFDAQLASLIRRGHPARQIERAEFARLEPQVANPPDRAILTQTEGAAQGDLVSTALLSRAARAGATVIAGRTVTGLTRSGDRITGVMTDLGPLSADHVVCAAGAWCQPLLATAGIDLPMHNKPGMIVHTTPVAPMVRHIVMSPDIHFRQAPNGRIILGEIFSGGFDTKTVAQADDLSADLITRLRRRLPGCPDLARDQIMLGTRPVPRDGLPVIGPAAHVTGLYIATMHSGVTLAPLVGQLVANELTTETADPDLAPFRHSRFV